jgi:GST-like protein
VGYTLFGSKGCGSAVVEVALELAGVAFAFEPATPWEPGPAVEKLRAVNPMVAVPTLVLPGGAVMTESAAILAWLAETHPAARLAPAAGSGARAQFHRWTVFAAASLYAPILVGDHPEHWLDEASAGAREALKAGAVRRTEAAWTVVESQLGGAADPFLLGGEMTMLDVYLAMISRWRPGRARVKEIAPKVVAACEAAERHPVVQRVWARNFD